MVKLMRPDPLAVSVDLNNHQVDKVELALSDQQNQISQTDLGQTRIKHSNNGDAI